jgi:hypothetical protein
MKRLVLSGLAVGAAMAISTAQAEPLTLSADQMDQVTAAGFGLVDFDAFLDKEINVTKTVNIEKVVTKFQEVDVTGLFGEADAFSNCFDASGFGCQATTESFTDAVSDFTDTGEPFAEVTSVSLSEAATSGFAIFTDMGGDEPQ